MHKRDFCKLLVANADWAAFPLTSAFGPAKESVMMELALMNFS